MVGADDCNSGTFREETSDDEDRWSAELATSEGGRIQCQYDNLRSICRNHAALGVQRFLVARAIEDGAQLKLCRDIIPAVNTVVCLSPRASKQWSDAYRYVIQGYRSE